MLAHVKITAQTLQETAARLERKAEDRRRVNEVRAKLPLLQKAAFCHLFNRIKNVYLLEFLILRVMQVETQELRTIGFRGECFEMITIRVGDEKIEVRPVISNSHPEVVSATLRNRSNGVAHEMYCDLNDAHPRWKAPVKESGFRKLIQKHLPRKAVDLDEGVFQSMINDALLGPQSIFNISRKHVKEGLSHLLDFITSDELRKSLAIGVASSASQVAKQVLLAAPAVRDTTLKAIPKLATSPLLLTGTRRAPAQPTEK